jgi:hypothetical protein
MKFFIKKTSVMKKLSLTSCVMMLALYSFAQGISGGIKAGLNLANQEYSSELFSLNTTTKLGSHGGVYVVAMITENFGIQPEVLFSMQGSNWDFQGQEGKFNFSYVNIPVLFRYSFNEMISIHGGPQFGFLLSAELENENGDSQDWEDTTKSMDLAGAIGVEFDLPNGLGFGARYTGGFSNVAEDDADFDGLEIRNRAIQLYAKYKIFGKK